MWYVNIRRLIGTYPKAAIAVITVPCAPLAAAVLSPVWWGILPCVALFLWSCYVGCILGRARLNIAQVRWATAYAWPITTAALLVFMPWDASWPKYSVEWFAVSLIKSGAFGAIFALPGAAAIWLGLAYAQQITVKKIRSGNWEVTMPVESPAADKEHNA